jgi:chromosome segregation ATPase
MEEKLMTEQIQPSPTFEQRVGRFLRGLVRLVLFGLIVAVVVVAIYYATPYIYSYALLPAQNNRLMLDELQQTQNQMQQDLTDYGERIGQLETQLAAEREARSELESKLTQQAQTISAQATVQAELEANLVAEQATAQGELAERLKAQDQTITTLEQSVDALDASLTDLDTAVAKVEEAINTPETEVVNLQQQTLILQISQAALKARLHLIENNPGQAQQSLEGAASALDRLEALIPPEKEKDLAEIQAQLQTVITAIEEQPFIATQELEILWELLQRFSEG